MKAVNLELLRVLKRGRVGPLSTPAALEPVRARLTFTRTVGV